jgi:hypothetical protein
MSSLRCPVCKAENSERPACRRCKADLSLLWKLEDARERRLAEARALAAAGHWPKFLSAVIELDRMRSDEETRRLRAVGCLLTGDFTGAVHAAQGASS